jgi:hypothetical protein
MDDIALMSLASVAHCKLLRFRPYKMYLQFTGLAKKLTHHDFDLL